MRNIKFKAKRLDNREWVEGCFYKECDNTYIIENTQSESMLNRNEAVLVDTSTVCQFTGLKDVSGKEVWEHDILATPLLKGEVVFTKGCYRVKKDNDPCFSFSTLYIIDSKMYNCRVIGNKFDRKEGEK